MFDVITIGSATRDVFLRSREFQILRSPKFKTGVGECFSLGSKIDVDEIHFFSGGSAINTAITFANQGLKTASIFKVGKNAGAGEIFKRLQGVGVNASLAKESGDYFTAYSVVLSAPGGERTILVHRGASEHLKLSEIPWSKIKTRWLFITHLGGESAKVFKQLIDFAAKRNINVALNPGRTQLDMGEKIIPYLNKVDVFFVNREEASYLTGVPYQKEKEIFSKLDEWVRGITVMTKGPGGVVVSDGEHRWKAGILKEPKLVDRLGAGDAFGSGFVAGLIKKKVRRGGGKIKMSDDAMEYVIQLASANATGVLGEWGGNNGLLKKGESIYKFGKLHIAKTKVEN